MAKDLVEMCTLFDLYGAMLTQRQQDIFDMYYNDDLSLAEISENTGITRQAVRDAILHAEETLRGCDEKLQLRQRLNAAQSEWMAIYEAAYHIRELNHRNYFDSRIEQESRAIMEAAQRHLPASDDE